jgi:hypothetical protein
MPANTAGQNRVKHLLDKMIMEPGAHGRPGEVTSNWRSNQWRSSNSGTLACGRRLALVGEEHFHSWAER